jgi:hypothetical protein
VQGPKKKYRFVFLRCIHIKNWKHSAIHVLKPRASVWELHMFASAAALAYKKELFFKVGGFGDLVHLSSVTMICWCIK